MKERFRRRTELKTQPLDVIYSAILNSVFYQRRPDKVELLKSPRTALKRPQITIDVKPDSDQPPTHQITIVMHRNKVQIDFSREQPSKTPGKTKHIYDNPIATEYELNVQSMQVWRVLRPLVLLILFDLQLDLYIDRTTPDRLEFYKKTLGKVLEEKGQRLKDRVTFRNDRKSLPVPAPRRAIQNPNHLRNRNNLKS